MVDGRVTAPFKSASLKAVNNAFDLKLVSRKELAEPEHNLALSHSRAESQGCLET